MVKNKKQIQKDKTASEDKLEKVLSNVRNGAGGTVSYVFILERFDREGNPIQNKSFLNAVIQPEIFFKLEGNKKVRRSLQEVMEVFRSTMLDIGASEFIID